MDRFYYTYNYYELLYLIEYIRDILFFNLSIFICIFKFSFDIPLDQISIRTFAPISIAINKIMIYN